MLVKVNEDNTVTEYTLSMLRKDNPNVSFPKNISIETLAEYGVYEVNIIPIDNSFDSTTKKAVRTPIELIDGVWTLGYEIVDLTTAEIQEDRNVKLTASISMAQCRTQLSREGLLSNVQSFVDNSNNEELQIAWEYATRLKRDNILFTQVATMLNKTEEQIDDMYISAMSIKID